MGFKLKLKPKDIITGDSFAFMGSEWGNTESEVVARNIVFILQMLNKEEWTPFSSDDYKGLCKHGVSERELGVLEAFVVGGRPVFNTSAVLKPGYLLKDELGLYCVTDAFIDAIPATQKPK